MEDKFCECGGKLEIQVGSYGLHGEVDATDEQLTCVNCGRVEY